MNTITGDLLQLADDGKFDVIAHGCNCFCTMGAGIAKQIRIKYPEAYQVDKITKSGDRNKLGTITYAVNGNLTIVNCYTQYNYGPGKVNIDYNALRKCLKEIKKQFTGKRIGLPAIGCGLAGGDYDKLVPIIEEELKDEDVSMVLLGMFGCPEEITIWGNKIGVKWLDINDLPIED